MVRLDLCLHDCPVFNLWLAGSLTGLELGAVNVNRRPYFLRGVYDVRQEARSNAQGNVKMPQSW